MSKMTSKAKDMLVWVMDEAKKLAKLNASMPKNGKIDDENQMFDYIENNSQIAQQFNVEAMKVVDRGFSKFSDITTEKEFAFALGAMSAGMASRIIHERENIIALVDELVSGLTDPVAKPVQPLSEEQQKQLGDWQQDILNRYRAPMMRRRHMLFGCGAERSPEGYTFNFQFQAPTKVDGIALLNFEPDSVVTSIMVTGKETLLVGIDVSVQEFTPASSLTAVFERYFKHAALTELNGDQFAALSRSAAGFGFHPLLEPLPIAGKVQITVRGQPLSGRWPHCDLLTTVAEPM